MRKLVLILLKKLETLLEKRTDLINKEEIKSLPYNSLSPIDNADIGNDYKMALDWALSNRKEKDIKNIALTGSYGSGKSSILKTYVTSYKGENLHFLNISLATFKEEEDSPGPSSREELLRLIELSILQQIFYHEEDRKIPDSRFKKIKSYKDRTLVVIALSIFIVFVSAVHLIVPTLIERLLKIEFSYLVTNVIHYSALGLNIVGSLVIIYKSIRVLNGISINKLNIQNTEISIDENVSKSILNHHIDEILYFFEVTDYNVVIIEDLDRFKQTEIFTKLREINLLINNSKKIKKDVVFIYAVRDDMFKGQNERTKFFDFIIPVIPVINPSNSSQKLLEKQASYGYNISENLIDSISLFIDDMRLLHNISNEFYLYSQKLNKSLSQEKLLSIIVYKNIFPTDFTLLSNNKGVLFASIDNKQKYINTEIDRLNDEIEVLKEEIKVIESLQIKSINELRYIYLLFYIPSLPGFISFNIDGSDRTLSEMVSDKYFNYLKNNKAQYKYLQSYYQYTHPIPVQFSSIEKQVDKTYTYSERSQQIEDWNNNKLELLKKRIQELEKSKVQARSLKVRELLEGGEINLDIEDNKQRSLISILLRNGFIDEDYLDYISIFYEGSITKNDHQFLINVKSQIQSDFNYKLTKIEKLIKKINPLEFDKAYTLNYNLLDFVLCNTEYDVIRDLIFTKLKDETPASLQFIEGFIDLTANIRPFIKFLIKRWPNIWSFLESKSNFTNERKDTYFKLIIEHADLDDLNRLYKDFFFRNSLLKKRNFLNIIPDSNRLKAVIETLKIKFTDLDTKEVPHVLLDYIYEGSFYEINIGMIRMIMKAKTEFKEADFGAKNYFAISNSGCEKLRGYIDANINEYVENVYLKLNSNIQEDEAYLISLLNNENLTIDKKELIVEQVETSINDLSDIGTVSVNRILLKKSKVSPKWDNIFIHFELDEETISESIITFLEAKENALELSKSKIIKDVDGEASYTTFVSKLITTEAISTEAYNMLLKSVQHQFDELDFSMLSEDKVASLISNNILTFNKRNYELIKKLFKNLQIHFLEINFTAFINNISDFAISWLDIHSLLISDNISLSEKNTLLVNIDEGVYSTQAIVIKRIGLLILKDNSFRVSDSVLKLILVNNELSVEQRIRIFNWKHNQISNDYLDAFLNSLQEPYSDITINGKRPLIADNEYNRKLIEIIQGKNYISSFDYEERGIRVSTFRKPIE